MVYVRQSMIFNCQTHQDFVKALFFSASASLTSYWLANIVTLR